ncbi:MAG: PTS sugar transporter subunit IIA [Treponema sp.]|nr:PTS sugar transporter subunit IIA [Treponema sp.]
MTETTTIEQSLADLIERGGIYYNVPGANKKDLLANAVGLLPPIPSLDPGNLLKEILDREALMSTGAGRGIALPHPRSPMLEKHRSELQFRQEPLVAVVFPVQPVDWNTPDGSKVHTLFLLVSSSAKQHLNALSKINFLYQQETFSSLIKARSSKEIIIAAIREAENTWLRSK